MSTEAYIYSLWQDAMPETKPDWRDDADTRLLRRFIAENVAES